MVISTEAEAKRRSRRAFVTLGLRAVASVAGFEWLMHTPDADGVPSGLRKVLQFNEGLTTNVLYRGGHLAPEFPRGAAQEIRANGDIGLGEDGFANWGLELVPYGTEEPKGGKITLAQVKSLPKVEYTCEFKCVEGWSTVVNWGGARLSDFTEKFAAGSAQAKYVGLQTPDEEYYVGLERASALHPQTLLAYEMNGSPLTSEHGAPLRLVTPLKYGIKNIKRIGRITFTDKRPDDFWAERGYDYYAAL